MQRLCFGIMMCLLLSVPCYGMGNTDPETRMWNAVEKESSRKCGYPGTQMPQPEEALKYTRCFTQIVEQRVLPVAKYHDLVVALNGKLLRDAEKCAKGKISATEWEVRAKEEMSSYVKKRNDRMIKEYQQALREEEKNKIVCPASMLETSQEELILLQQLSGPGNRHRMLARARAEREEVLRRCKAFVPDTTRTRTTCIRLGNDMMECVSR